MPIDPTSRPGGATLTAVMEPAEPTPMRRTKKQPASQPRSQRGREVQPAGAPQASKLAPPAGAAKASAAAAGAAKAPLAPAGPAPAAIAAVARLYGIDGTEAKPARRLLRWATELHDALAQAQAAKDPVSAAMAPDVRRIAFMLEGLFRMYADAYGKPAEKGQARVKELEDQLGAYGHATDMQAAARKAPGVPAELLRWLDDQAEEERQALHDLMEEWQPGKDGKVPALERVFDRILSIEWKKGAKDRDIIQASLAAQLERIADDELDMNELQEGLHELRRQLRWPPIYGQALGGALVLTDDVVPEPRYAALLTQPVADSPFGKLPVSADEARPLAIPRTLFLRLTELIDELGKLKDRGEAVEGLAHALVEVEGLSHKKASRRAAALLGQPEDTLEQVAARAKELYPEVKRLARLLADNLR